MGTRPAAIVDAHHHLWDLGRGGYPWLQQDYNPAVFHLGDYEPLRRNFGPAEYRSIWQGLPLAATVHVEAERDRKESLAETAWLHEIHAVHEFPNAVVAHVDFASPDADEQLAQHAAFALVRGIRCKPLTSANANGSVRGQPGSLQDEQWLAGLALLENHGLSWDLRVPFWHLEEAAAVVQQLPGISVVLEHAGLPWDRSAAGLAHWRKGMEALARHDQVHVKLSEFGLRHAPWNADENTAVIRDTIAIFGWQRCMFASNMPVAGLRIGVPELVDTMAGALKDLSEAAQSAIWHDNARRFYRIPDVTGLDKN